MPNYYTIDDGSVVITARREGRQHVIPLPFWFNRRVLFFNGKALKFVINVHPKDKQAGNLLYIERMLVNDKRVLVFNRTIPTQLISLDKDIKFNLQYGPQVDPDKYKVAVTYEIFDSNHVTKEKYVDKVLVDFELAHRDRLLMWWWGVIVTFII